MIESESQKNHSLLIERQRQEFRESCLNGEAARELSKSFREGDMTIGKIRACFKEAKQCLSYIDYRRFKVILLNGIRCSMCRKPAGRNRYSTHDKFLCRKCFKTLST